MSDKFEPFLPPTSTGNASTPAQQNAASFEPMMPETTQTPPDQSAPAPSSMELSPGAKSPGPEAAHQPSIQLHRDGDRITRIDIQCKCGEKLHLDCRYE